MNTTRWMLPCLVLAWVVVARPVCAGDAAATQPAPVRTFSAVVYGVQDPTRSILRHYWRAPDQLRVEPTPGIGATTQPGAVPAGPRLTIRNATGHAQTQLTILGPSALIFHTMRFDGPPPADPGYPEQLRRLRDLEIPGLIAQGTETIEGRELLRYEVPAEALKRVCIPDGITTIWVDPATKRTVSFQFEDHMDLPNGKQAPNGLGYKDLRFNEPLDDSLFTWPELKGKAIELHIQIIGPKNLDRDKLRLSITAPDGTRLLSEADCQPGFLDPRFGSSPRYIAMWPAGLTRLSQYVGQKLRVAVNDAPAQEVELPGPVKDFSVYLPLDPPAETAPNPVPATQPAR
jgi:hypothetical protein